MHHGLDRTTLRPPDFRCHRRGLSSALATFPNAHESLLRVGRCAGRRLHRFRAGPEGVGGRKCAGLRTPATATLPHAPTAGVGNWPRDEIAEGGAPRVRLALWGFERARRDDGGGSAP